MPEPLRGNLSGYWSRRIDQKNRLVYRALRVVGGRCVLRSYSAVRITATDDGYERSVDGPCHPREFICAHGGNVSAAARLRLSLCL